jgi:CheY-like chemotaxis protein
VARGARDRQPFDVVLTDLHMPSINGIELARELARTWPALPVIILSSGGGRETPRGQAPDNVAAYLTKPARRSQLQESLGAALGALETESDPTPLAASPDGPHGTVLVVDDLAVNRQVARMMLERGGYTVHVAEDGARALEAMRSQEYDVVLMDCEMPVLDGYEAAREIRRREAALGRRTPIIALTASAMKGDAERALEAGMDLHVPKPIDLEQLHSAVRSVTEGSRP